MAFWEQPSVARFLRRLAAGFRLIVKDLVAGSELRFAEHGETELKGFPAAGTFTP